MGHTHRDREKKTKNSKTERKREKHTKLSKKIK